MSVEQGVFMRVGCLPSNCFPMPLSSSASQGRASHGRETRRLKISKVLLW